MQDINNENIKNIGSLKLSDTIVSSSMIDDMPALVSCSLPSSLKHLEETMSGCSAAEAGSFAIGTGTEALCCAAAAGEYSVASGYASHAEGWESYSDGEYSHSEGDYTVAKGSCSHSEGYASLASGYAAHAEGDSTTAAGECSHAEGIHSGATWEFCHAEGSQCAASGKAAHAEGYSAAAGYLVKVGQLALVSCVTDPPSYASLTTENCSDEYDSISVMWKVQLDSASGSEGKKIADAIGTQEVAFGYEGWNVSKRDWALYAEGDKYSLTAYGLADTPGCAMWHNKIQIECAGEDGHSAVVSLFADKNSID